MDVSQAGRVLPHQGNGCPSRKNPPVGPSSGSRHAQVMLRAPSGTRAVMLLSSATSSCAARTSPSADSESAPLFGPAEVPGGAPHSHSGLSELPADLDAQPAGAPGHQGHSRPVS
jgi:hypothetical protein